MFLLGRRYNNRTVVLATCQQSWYALEGNTALSYAQTVDQQAQLPCRLSGVGVPDLR